MNEHVFKNFVEAVIVSKLEDPKTIPKQCEAYWKEIESRQYNFKRGINLDFFLRVFLSGY